MNFFIAEIIERRGADPLLKFLQDLGGWPVIEPSWNASNFKLEETVGTLRNMHNDILISLVRRNQAGHLFSKSFDCIAVDWTGWEKFKLERFTGYSSLLSGAIDEIFFIGS